MPASRRTRFAVALLFATLTTISVASPSTAAAAPEAVLSGVVAVDTGDSFSCALLASGQVRCWGRNHVGQLGNDDFGVDSPVPVAVRNVANTGTLTGVTQLDVGENHVCARLGTGGAVCWGAGGSSQLGDGGGVNRDTPVAVRNAADTADLTGITQISAGALSSCARVVGGQARCWGDNSQGQIGSGDAPADAFTPRPVRNATDTANLTGVTQVSVGADFACARLNTGQVRCWGNSASGQVGDGQAVDSDLPVTVRSTTGSGALAGVTQVSAGNDHSCAVLTSSQLVCWGDGSSNALGDGTNSDSLFPGAVANAAGDGNLRGVTAVEAGANATCARLNTGRALCWGNGGLGRLGNGDALGRTYPTAVRNLVDTAALRNVLGVSQSSGNHGCVVLVNQQARCFGANPQGQLGNDDAPNDSLLPVVVFPA